MAGQRYSSPHQVVEARGTGGQRYRCPMVTHGRDVGLEVDDSGCSIRPVAAPVEALSVSGPKAPAHHGWN